MANTIKPKRSNTASKVPNTSELVSGELGVNMADKKIYINNGTSIVQVGAGVLSALGDVALTSPASGQSLSYNGTNWVNSNAGAGDVVGAASSTDNAITRFDGTTGKVIQNSVVVIDDSGNVSGVNSITNPDTIGFNTAYATPLTAGQLGWDNTYNTLGFGMSGNNIIQHIGEDTYIYIKATAAITKGQVIMFTGSVGASGVLTGAPATGVTSGQYIVGVAAESIALNGFGYVQTFGELRNVNTSAFADGDILYYNSAVTGGFTTTFPTSGLIVTVAAVVNGGSVGGGVIQIRVTVTQRITASTGITVTQTNAGSSITNSGVLGVTATSPVASSGGQNPVISMPAATTSVSGYLTSTDWNTFNNKTSNTGTVTSVATGTGLTGGTITTTGTISLANTAVTAGSYTNTNITVDAQGRITAAASGSGGGVTSVTGTAPVVSSGGATPAISMAAATTSVNGYLTSTDWNTFNNKYSVGGALGTPSSGTLTNCTFPTLNQNTTGSSGSCTGNAATATNPQSGGTFITSSNIGSQSVNYAATAGSAPANGGTATALNSSNYISQHGSDGGWNADFQNTPAGTTRYNGDVGANTTQNPGNTWWIQQNFRHTNASNYWGTQVAWGWEDNANRLATRNVTSGTFGAWVYYLNSANFTSYAPSLTGSGASGTWGINVTGSSASCSGNAATATALSTASGSAPSYAARAWVNFNGQGTIAIRASGNVSSITDNGAGRYQVNFTTNMVDINYSIHTSTSGGVSGQFPGTPAVNSTINLTSRAPLVNNFTFYTCAWNNTAVGIDEPWLMVAVFR